MAKKDFTNKENYLINQFKLDTDTVKSITEIGKMVGNSQYNIWIAKEVKKDASVIERTQDIQYILDWVKSESPDLMSLSFKEAMSASNKWHKELFDNDDQKPYIPNKEQDKSDIDKYDERIVFKCSDKKHFFLILKPEDLAKEGNLMRHCVGNYTDKVRTGKSMILSLRDDKNYPHVTIEVDTDSGTVVQTRGVANSEPSKKYKNMLIEFAIYASGYDKNIVNEYGVLIKI